MRRARFAGRWLAMTAFAVVVSQALGISDVEAISRYNPTSMTCSQVKATVKAKGAVILRWQSPRDPSLPLFGRYVANVHYCSAGEIVDLKFVPASDTRSCGVLTCRRNDRDDDRLRFKLLLGR
jgi:hypothetical protein